MVRVMRKPEEIREVGANAKSGADAKSGAAEEEKSGLSADGSPAQCEFYF